MTTDRTCPSCAAPLDNGTICQTCLDKLHRDLDAITDHMDQLDIQLARLARIGDNGGGARSAERPLPYDLPASEALDLLRSVLVGWTRDVCETRGNWPANTMVAMARRLRFHDWRNHPAADEFADELHFALGEARVCIDTPPERRYLGPCGSIDLDGHECPGDVVMVGTHMPKCQACGATYFRDDRLQWVADMAADQLVTATIAAGALSAWGEHITPDLVRKWAQRGRLIAHGHDRAGRPVYVFGDCRVLALDSLKRTATRARAEQ